MDCFWQREPGQQLGAGCCLWVLAACSSLGAGWAHPALQLQASCRPPLPTAVRCRASPGPPLGCCPAGHFGKCNETYMFDANAELAPEGFCQARFARSRLRAGSLAHAPASPVACAHLRPSPALQPPPCPQMSCSRCNCCQSPYDVIQGLGATRFLQVRAGALCPACSKVSCAAILPVRAPAWPPGRPHPPCPPPSPCGTPGAGGHAAQPQGPAAAPGLHRHPAGALQRGL